MESVTEGTVVEWRVAVGDAVAAEQILLEVSTDKVDLEVPAPAAGRMASIEVEAGATFTVGQPLGTSRPAPPARRPPRRPPPRRPSRPAPSPPPRPATAEAPAGAELEWPKISPVARRLALEHGIDPGTLTGTGAGGMIRKEDVVAAASGAAAPAAEAPARPPRRPPAAPAAGEEAVALRGPAAALAGYMDASLSIPTATSFRTVDVGTLEAQRRQINPTWPPPVAAKAIVHPSHRVGDGERGRGLRGDGHRLRAGRRHASEAGPQRRQPRSLAVDVQRKDGSRSLLVPVIRDAASLGFKGFREAYDDLVGAARAPAR